MRSFRIEYKWVIVGVAFFTMLVASGARNSFGVFLTPMQEEFATGRAPLALTVSIGSLVGALCQPLVGKLADSFGSKVVLAAGAILAGVGLIAMGFAQNLLMVYLLFGLMLGVGYSASGVIPSATLVSRWFVEQRALALSIATAGFSVGQVVLLPVAAQLIEAGGWRFAYSMLGLLFLLGLLPMVLLLSKDVPKAPSPTSTVPSAEGHETPGKSTPMREAMRTGTFWKLFGTFGVCGFTGGLAYTHLIPFARDAGMSALAAANLFSAVGTVGVVGSIGVASISERIGRKKPLSGLYFMKGFALLLMAVVGGVAAFPLVALTLGMSKGTGALTSAMTGDFYGRLSIGAIYGMVFLAHEVAAATGSYLGGLAFDLTGSYKLIFLVGAVAGLLGSITAFTINERPRKVAEPLGAGAAHWTQSRGELRPKDFPSSPKR